MARMSRKLADVQSHQENLTKIGQAYEVNFDVDLLLDDSSMHNSVRPSVASRGTSRALKEIKESKNIEELIE